MMSFLHHVFPEPWPGFSRASLAITSPAGPRLCGHAPSRLRINLRFIMSLVCVGFGSIPIFLSFKQKQSC